MKKRKHSEVPFHLCTDVTFWDFVKYVNWKRLRQDPEFDLDEYIFDINVTFTPEQIDFFREEYERLRQPVAEAFIEISTRDYTIGESVFILEEMIGEIIAQGEKEYNLAVVNLRLAYKKYRHVGSEGFHYPLYPDGDLPEYEER